MVGGRLMRSGRLPIYLAGAALLYMMVVLFRASGNGGIIGINISGDIHLTGQQIQSLHAGNDDNDDRNRHGQGQGQQDHPSESQKSDGDDGAGRAPLPVNKYAHKGNCPTGKTMPGYNDDTSWNRSDVMIVAASVKRFGTKWITEELKENKGNEANVYLRYIIEHYDDLPEVMIFLHGHRDSLHIDLAFGSNYMSVRRLNLDHVRRIGYQSLNCGHEYICDENQKGRVWWWGSLKETKEAWPVLFPNDPEPPKTLYGPPYAQFAVSKKTVWRNSKADYEKWLKWLMETDQKDWDSGRVFEYSWAYIFGMGAFYCVQRDECMCEGFGLCDLKSHMSEAGFPEVPEAERQKQLDTEANIVKMAAEKEQKKLQQEKEKEKQQADSIFGQALQKEVENRVKKGKEGNKRRSIRQVASGR